MNDNKAKKQKKKKRDLFIVFLSNQNHRNNRAATRYRKVYHLYYQWLFRPFGSRRLTHRNRRRQTTTETRGTKNRCCQKLLFIGQWSCKEFSIQLVWEFFIRYLALLFPPKYNSHSLQNCTPAYHAVLLLSVHDPSNRCMEK